MMTVWVVSKSSVVFINPSPAILIKLFDSIPYFIKLFAFSSVSQVIVTLSPVMVPLFMRSNITPEFTQFLFRVTDGISKLISPVFGGFIVMLVFAEKYNQENEKFGLTGLLKKMNSTIVLFIILWLLIITGWYIVGLPLGYGVNSTL